MWFIVKYRRAIISAMAGVVVGVFFWKVLPYLLGSLSSVKFQYIIHNADAITERYPFASASVMAIIFGALFAFPEQIKRVILFPKQMFQVSTVIETLFANEADVYLIIPHMTQQDFIRVDTNERIHLPKNAPFLPATHGIAIGKLESHVNEIFSGKKRVKIYYDLFPPFELKEHNFIVLGGPFVNRIGNRLLDFHRNTLVKGFELTNDPFGKDENDLYRPERDPRGGADGPLITDYGFIIIVPSHLNPERRVCFMFGLWPFRRLVSRDEGVLAVVKVEITGLADGAALFVKVRQLSGTSARRIAQLLHKIGALSLRFWAWLIRVPA